MALDRILIVDDEDLIRWSLQQKLTNWGYRALEAPDGNTAIELAETESPDLILLDIQLPDKNGLEVLRAVRETNPRVVVIIMTAYGVLEDAVAALRLGAYDFVSKPLNFEELKATIQNALEAVKLRQEVKHFRERDRKRFSFENIIGESDAMQESMRIFRDIRNRYLGPSGLSPIPGTPADPTRALTLKTPIYLRSMIAEIRAGHRAPAK